MQVQYLSPAWAEKALRLVETDPRLERALQGFELSILTIILHPPKGCYGFLYAAFDADGLKDYRVGFDFASVVRGLPEPTFTVSGEMPSVKFGKLNTDENQMTAATNGVMSIPTLMVYKDGRKVDQIVGAVPKEMLVASLKRHL